MLIVCVVFGTGTKGVVDVELVLELDATLLEDEQLGELEGNIALPVPLFFIGGSNHVVTVAFGTVPDQKSPPSVNDITTS